MKVSEILERLKGGDRIMVDLSARPHESVSYSLLDGTRVRSDQFACLRDQIEPDSPALFECSQPQSYRYAGATC